MRMTRVIAILLVLCGWIAPASAATVFFYSDVDEHYGWSAGYNYARSEADAHQSCVEFGGTDCKYAVECDGGWGSIAFADDSAKGVGMICGLNGAWDARTFALALCMSSSNAMCWTYLTTDEDGRELSTESNTTFDIVYLGQQMLRVMYYDPGEADGEVGPKTREAVKAFQATLGLEQTGELDETLFWRMVDAIGGIQKVAAGLKEFVVDPQMERAGKLSFTMSSEPYPQTTHSQEIATFGDVQRRETLATLLTVWGRKCTIPAISAVPVPEDGTGAWQIKCAEGDHTLIYDNQTRTVMDGIQAVSVGADGSITIGGDSPAPGGGDTPPPAGGGGNSLNN